MVSIPLQGIGQRTTGKSLRAAFDRHLLLLFRDLDLDTEQQLELARVFGEPVLREKNQNKDPRRRSQYVSNVMDDGVFATGELDFHMDQLFWPNPLRALMLYGVEVPDNGGLTRFADCTSAFAAMPAELRDRIEGLSCRHVYTFAGRLAEDWNVDDAAEHALATVHPIVWRDGDPARCGLWVNKITTLDVVGFSPEESADLIAEIRGYLYDDDRIYSHRWRPGDLVLWHNHFLQHARTPYDESQPRTLRRTTLL